MSLFTPRLEPGETLIAQLPAKPAARQLAPGAALAVAAATVFCGTSLWLGGLDRTLTGLPVGLGVGISVLGIFWNGHAWVVALTDRRLLVRRAAPWRAPYEIARDKIESVRKDIAGCRIIVRGGEQEIAIDANKVEVDAVKRLLGNATELP